MSLNHYNLYKQRIELFLTARLQQCNQASELVDAMRYATLLGGKRIRPILVYVTGQMLNVSLDVLDYAAAAVEVIHCFSLIHDDLPAMDNDILRRGKPSCHIQFDEATAILAGDALNTLAFQILTESTLVAEQKIKQIACLAKASGVDGICLGQHFDLLSSLQHQQQNLEQIDYLKTSCLLIAALELAFYVSEHFNDLELQNNLNKFGTLLGLAFQIKDDLLDVVGDSNQTGKTTGIDAINNKITYASLFGVAGCEQKLIELQQSIQQCLSQINFDTTELQQIADFVIERTK